MPGLDVGPHQETLQSAGMASDGPAYSRQPAVRVDGGQLLDFHNALSVAFKICHPFRWSQTPFTLTNFSLYKLMIRPDVC